MKEAADWIQPTDHSLLIPVLTNLSPITLTPNPSYTPIWQSPEPSWIPFALKMKFKLYPYPLPYPSPAQYTPITANCTWQLPTLPQCYSLTPTMPSIPLPILPIQGQIQIPTPGKSLCLPYVLSHLYGCPLPTTASPLPYNCQLLRDKHYVTFNSVSLAVPHIALSVHWLNRLLHWKEVTRTQRPLFLTQPWDDSLHQSLQSTSRGAPSLPPLCSLGLTR